MESDLSHLTSNQSQEFFQLFLLYYAQALQCHVVSCGCCQVLRKGFRKNMFLMVSNISH